MAEIKFSDEEKKAIGLKVQRYVEEELDLEIGQFDAEFLLDFFAREIGEYFYNRGHLRCASGTGEEDRRDRRGNPATREGDAAKTLSPRLSRPASVHSVSSELIDEFRS